MPGDPSDQRSDGWASYVDLEHDVDTQDDLPTKEDITEPQPAVDPRVASADPVLAAIGELDGAEAAERAAIKANPPAPAGEPQRPERLRLASPDDVKTPAPLPEGLNAIADVLNDSVSRPAPALDAGRFWHEWRELILTAIGGALVLAAVLIMRSNDAPTEAPPSPPALPARPPPPSPTAAPSTVNKIIAPAPKAPAQPPPKAATPMLSVTSEPSGAMVEINGLVRGKTPLVIPSPARTPSIRVRLTHDHHRAWEGDITANEAGHYTKRVELERR